MKNLVFILPIAAGDVSRAINTIKSINRFCSEHIILCSLDGNFSAETIKSLPNTYVFPSLITSKGHWGAIWHNQFRSLLDYKKKHKTTEETIYIKIDSDAIILRNGLYERAYRIMYTRKKIGLIGQINNDVNGLTLTNDGWKNYYIKMLGWGGFRDFVIKAVMPSEINVSLSERFARYSVFKSLVRKTKAPEKYAIGGCYIVSDAFLSELERSKLLETNPFLLRPNYGEDAITGLVVQALGFNIIDDVLDDGIFAVGGIYNKYEEVFRCDPRDIRKRNHIVIHPVKFGYKSSISNLSEDELVKELIDGV